jgi:hypothetical protein
MHCPKSGSEHQRLITRRIIAHRCLAVVLLAVLLCVVPTCNAQTKYPDTPAGNQAKGLLDGFNLGDGPKYKESK